MANFDKSTPFMLLARIHVKPNCVEAYLELARTTDAAVQASEPGMLHHTFDQDPDDPQAFVWSELYANDAAFAASFPPVEPSEAATPARGSPGSASGTHRSGAASHSRHMPAGRP